MAWSLTADTQLTLYLFGALLALQICDVLTGWLAAIVQRSVSSRVSWAGISRKCLTLVVILAVGIVNAIAPAPLNQLPLTTPVLIGYLISELYSILENAARAGALHPLLAAYLAQRVKSARKEAHRATRVGPDSDAGAAGSTRPGPVSHGPASSPNGRVTP